MEAFLVLARHEQPTHLTLAQSALPNAPVQPEGRPSRLRRAVAWARSLSGRRQAEVCPRPATSPTGVRYSA